ncbi:type II CAAX endopeptidase family protein [Kitasatospora sp. NPDC036755]|uniref:CPBP family intramembrane glutamic endopeptidase n=1 Tax=Kitasatospora sp. NPDC036755 TaxID=3154600 RepID=UPI0033D89BA4
MSPHPVSPGGTTIPPGPVPAARRSGLSSAAAATAVLLAGVPAPWLREHPAALAVVLLTIAGAGAVALCARSAPAQRTVLAAATVLALVLVFGVVIWPAPLLLGPVAVWLAIRYRPALRPGVDWLRRGKLGRGLSWQIAATIAVSATALILWALITDPVPGPYLTSMQSRPVVVAMAGVLAFSLLNAACEEAAYRGVFQSELTALMGAGPAVVVQAAGFGLAHATGFPSGPAGILLATVYGLMLGVIRHRSAGLLAPYLAHVCADLTIGALALTVLAS